MEVWKVVPSWLAISSTIKDSYTMETWRSSYTVEVWKVVPSWLVASSIIKGFLCHGSMMKFLHRGSVEGCTELVGCIEYHKGFLCRGRVERF